MPFVMVSVDVQLTVPAGTITVSPSEAKEIAALTSFKDALAALTVAPLALLATTMRIAFKTRTRRNRKRSII
jgi:hypothetical protein